MAKVLKRTRYRRGRERKNRRKIEKGKGGGERRAGCMCSVCTWHVHVRYGVESAERPCKGAVLTPRA